MGDAIVRTLVRLYVTRRRLLEWVTAAQAKSGLSLDLGWRLSPDAWGAVLAVAAGLLVALVRPGTWPIAAPFSCCGPSRRSSRDGSASRRAPTRPQRLSAPDARTPPLDRTPHLAVLRGVRRSRRTRSCRRTTSRRTRSRSSPTARRRPTSASTCCRRSPPAISAGSGRSTPSTGSRRRSRRWAGSSAFAATSTTGTRRRDLRPLEPRYVSTVDSGNLAEPAPRSRQCLSRGARTSAVRSGGLRRNRGRGLARA